MPRLSRRHQTTFLEGRCSNEGAQHTTPRQQMNDTAVSAIFVLHHEICLDVDTRTPKAIGGTVAFVPDSLPTHPLRDACWTTIRSLKTARFIWR